MELKQNSRDIKDIIETLKVSKLNKANYILSKEDKESFIDFINNVENTNKEYDKIQTLSTTLTNVDNQIKDKNDKIKTLEENNESLNLRINKLNNLIKDKDEEIYYCYDKFCEQYKIIQDSFFSALSTIYHVSNDDIEVIYNKYKKVNMKDVFMDINFGYDGESLTSDNSHLVYSKLNRLLEKFPKIKEIIGNSYLYTDINEESSLKMLDDVQVGRILVKKIRDSVNEEAN